MKDFSRVQLREVVSIKGGKRLPLGEDFNPQKTSHPYIRARDIGNGNIRISDAVYLSDGVAHKLSRYKVSKGDVCITIVGANVGEMGVVPPELDGANLTENAVRITSNGKIFQGFLKYALLAEDALAQMKGLAGGAAQPKLGIYKIETIEIPLPPLPTQRKIAAILSAYDDLIENNLRRIKILEEMAQNLYHEWFVKFRFPGHQDASFVDSTMGRIPEGWEVKIMPDAVTVRPTLPIPKNKQVPFVSMGSLSETSMLISEFEYRSKASGARFQNGDTLFARITPCLENGKTGFVQFLSTADTIACGSTEFIVLRSKTVCPEYVYLMARSAVFRDNAIKSMSGATGRQRVRDECFDQFLLAQPPDAVLERFKMTTRPQFELIHSLNCRNQNLRRTRDLLLPRLISGEVDVSELDITVPEDADA